MVSMKKIISYPSGALFISILLGLGLASIFRKVCHDRSCLVVQTIPPKKLINTVLRRDKKCYQWVPQTITKQE